MNRGERRAKINELQDKIDRKYTIMVRDAMLAIEPLKAELMAIKAMSIDEKIEINKTPKMAWEIDSWAVDCGELVDIPREMVDLIVDFISNILTHIVKAQEVPKCENCIAGALIHDDESDRAMICQRYADRMRRTRYCNGWEPRPTEEVTP